MIGELTERDRDQLRKRGITEAELERQQELFQRPPRYARLVRPCKTGDGIEVLSPERIGQLHALHAEAAAGGRLIKFVPASGAASRMFRDLLRFRKEAGGDRRPAGPSSPELLDFIKGLERFAFHAELADTLARKGQDLAGLKASGDYLPIVEALLDATGMNYDALPKALLKFHGTGAGARTAFEEHLVEAANYVRDAAGRCRLHFTVSPEHRAAFEALSRDVLGAHGKRFEVEFDINYSVQKLSTDTLAVTLDNLPLRDEQGKLVFRPAGHGALIENLNDLEGDVVFVKNIDNVQPDRLKTETLRWKPALAGLLIELQRQAAESLGRLTGGRPDTDPVQEALRGIGRQLHLELNGNRLRRSAGERREYLIERLDRPLRVCGVVPNTGEPGGGPFWVRGADGTVSPQIVESAEVDPADEEQQAIFRSSTHFNPVDLVCGVRDFRGEPFDLRRFVDPEAVMVTRKSSGGVDLKALERPGLWNGAMADWNTVFVEVPLTTFSPVKTVLDLLRDEHQA